MLLSPDEAISSENIAKLIQQGESSHVEFKTAEVNVTSLAEEIVAFANLEGGRLLIGVNDIGKVLGCPVKELEERVINVCRNNIRPALIPLIAKVIIQNQELLVVTIRASDVAHCTTQGKYLVRVGSTKQIPTQAELLRLFQRKRMLQFDELPVLNATAEHIDLGRVEYYLTNLGSSPLAMENAEARLRDLRILSILSEIEPGTHPTIAGLLTFGWHPQKCYPAYTILCGAYLGEDLVSDTLREKELHGPLADLIEDAIAFLKLTIPQNIHLVNGTRQETIYSYPIEALREAVVNAVAHRDYTMTGAAIRLFVFQGRIEVRSPGSLPNTLTLESLPYRQFTRNQTIATFLSGFGYMERRGKGILRMQKLSAAHGITCDFSLTPDQAEFVVTFSQ